MNRYRHQLQSSPSDAEANRPQMVDHLANCDRQLTAALHMLDRLGRYKDKILKQIGSYTHRPRHRYQFVGCFRVGRGSVFTPSATQPTKDHTQPNPTQPTPPYYPMDPTQQ